MEGYPVVEAQQEQQQDSVLVKLQLELQEQLQPQHSDPVPSTSAHEESTARVLARLTPVPPSPIAADAAREPETAEATAAAPSSSSSSFFSASGTDAASSASAPDAATDAAVADAMSSSLTVTSAHTAGQSAQAPAGPVTAATPSRADSERCLSSADDDWHMVSRGSSVKATSSSGRCSFDDAEAEAAAAGTASPFEPTDASECGSDSATPRDELAASILGHPVMVAAQQQLEAAAAAAAEVAANADAADIQEEQSAGLLSSSTSSFVFATPGPSTDAAESSPAPDASGPATAAELPAAAAGADGCSDAAVAAAPDSEVVVGPEEALGLLSGGLLQLAGAAQARAFDGLDGLREWLVESLAALVQTGRLGQAACVSTAQTTLRNLQLAAKQGGFAAAAVHAAADWRVLLSSAAAVVCLAMWMKSRREATALRSMLRRRDHELSKLVMRVVSLQELINQGGHLQAIGRYSRFEGAAVSAGFM